mmetsp:Transcript_38453/g.93404  ORF Transcript_38453/g.93404 Transcript_38453/m.93404 type:complete len:230 (+) Transcript_38453:3-692(+)
MARLLLACICASLYGDATAYQLRTSRTPLARVRTIRPYLCAPAGGSSSLSEEPVPPERPASPLSKARAWVRKYAKIDKKQIASLGFDAFFTYGFVSNVNAGLTIALAWGTFCQSSGLSPLVPGQWPKFLAVYVGIYATLGTLLRPVRMAIAIGLTPKFSKFVTAIQEKLPFRSSRPKLNRGLALACVSFMGNFVCTLVIIGLGIWLSSIFTGVPAIPAGYSLLKRASPA